MSAKQGKARYESENSEAKVATTGRSEEMKQSSTTHGFGRGCRSMTDSGGRRGAVECRFGVDVVDVVGWMTRWSETILLHEWRRE